ncbi:hypothetical protein [Luteimonas marina]|nr:hypothetical protein [Luteimonas marina]
MAPDVIPFPKPKREPVPSAEVERLVAVLERALETNEAFRRLFEAKVGG